MGPKKKKAFGKGVLLRSIWITLLILKCLNTENRKLFILVFSFQIILFNDTFINILKTIGPTY